MDQNEIFSQINNKEEDDFQLKIRKIRAEKIFASNSFYNHK